MGSPIVWQKKKRKTKQETMEQEKGERPVKEEKTKNNKEAVDKFHDQKRREERGEKPENTKDD
jgi:hypothetical protein